MRPISLALLTCTALAARDWRMLDSYPPHYVATALAADEVIEIDGRLDEPAWLAAPCRKGFGEGASCSPPGSQRDEASCSAASHRLLKYAHTPSTDTSGRPESA